MTENDIKVIYNGEEISITEAAHNAIENVIKPFVIDNPDFVW